MKNIVRFCLLILCVTCYSCDDPYKDTVFKVYDVQPAATYLQSRPNDFSEWVKVLKYGDLFNAINRADDAFTVLAPTNDAVLRFYKKKGVASIEDLGYEYARTLVTYHVINDSIDREDFVKSGELPGRTLSGDALKVTFGSEGGDKSIYINNEAHVSELAIRAANGRIYVLDDVLSPAVETIFARLSDKGGYTIFSEALQKTTWSDSLNVINSVLEGPLGMKVELRKYFTVFAVSDAVFAKEGITSFGALTTKVGALTDDYELPNNELNRFIAYHIMDGEHTLASLRTFPRPFDREIWDYRKMLNTRAVNDLILISGNGLNDGVQFVENESDEIVKNGYIQPIDGYLPVETEFEPIPVIFDFCDYPEVSSYIAAKGKGQLYQQVSRDEKDTYTALTKFIGRQEIVPQVSSYQLTMGPSGSRASDWGNLAYCTKGSATSGNWTKLMNNDALVVNIGLNGSLNLTIPPILAGKYRITLYYAYDPSLLFLGKREEGSQAGLTNFRMDSKRLAGGDNKRIYDAKTGDVQDCFNTPLTSNLSNVETPFEFTTTTSHTLNIVVVDPAASSHDKFRMYFDYILFEPINE